MADTDPVAHMSMNDFRRHGREMVDWIVGYWERLKAGDAALPVLSRSKPGQVAGMLPAKAPERGEAWETVWADVERVVMPGLTHWQSPNFFAFFPSNGSPPAVLGELLSAGLGVQGMLWATSPACTELETRVLDWMAELIGLPEPFRSTSTNGGGVIQGTASEAAVVAMCAARHRDRAADRAGPGQAGREWVVYTSTQAHSSIVKAAMVTGIADGPDDRIHARLIGVDAQLRMRPDLLEAAIDDDLAAGRRPIFVCATVGTTSSLAIDDLQEIGAITRRHGLWLHVDAAMAGAACICPEHRWMIAGVHLADSFCFNPHKWLLTSFDCDLLWTSDRRSLTGAMSITPEYLRNAASDAGAVIDYRDWQVPLGRRFRSLKLWFVMRCYGAEGLRAYIREHVRLGALAEQLVRADGRFEFISRGGGLSLICFRLKAPAGQNADALNRALLDRINARGRIYLTHTVLPETGVVLRLAIGATMTQEEHVRAAWEEILSTALN